MRLRTTGSDEIDAEFDMDIAGPSGWFALSVHSANGQQRNPDYSRLLEELLRRVAQIGVVLEDAYVDSRATRGLSRASRRIAIEGRPYPVQLGPSEDFRELRRGLTRPQSAIASRTRGKGGNRTKRITLQFRCASPLDAHALSDRLGAYELSASEALPGIALGLTADDISLAVRQWSSTGKAAFLARFDSLPDERYLLVDGDCEMDATALLVGARALAGRGTGGPWRVERADVLDPLRRMGFGVVDLDRPLEAPFGGDPGEYADLAARLGGTDIAARRVGRLEQRYLRGALGIGSGEPAARAQCGMCGRCLPESLLVAAHIKPHRDCTHEERLDMPHVGWALCLLGCDALFERGYVVVDEGGVVRTNRAGGRGGGGLTAALLSLHGSTAVGWTSQRAPYFAAHRQRHT